MTSFHATAPATLSYLSAPNTLTAADCLGCIITGRPLPQGVQAREILSPVPTSVEEALQRILRTG